MGKHIISKNQTQIKVCLHTWHDCVKYPGVLTNKAVDLIDTVRSMTNELL